MTFGPDLNYISLVMQRNEVEREMISLNNVTRDSVMQISISVIPKRDFGGNTSIYECDNNIIIIHRGPSFQQVKNTLYMYNIGDFIFYFRTLQFLWIANCNKWIGG